MGFSTERAVEEMSRTIRSTTPAKDVANDVDALGVGAGDCRSGLSSTTRSVLYSSSATGDVIKDPSPKMQKEIFLNTLVEATGWTENLRNDNNGFFPRRKTVPPRSISAESSTDCQSVCSLSLQECLAQKDRIDEDESDLSIRSLGSMPSLVSHGNDSLYSLQSHNSFGSVYTSSSGDLSFSSRAGSTASKLARGQRGVNSGPKLPLSSRSRPPGIPIQVMRVAPAISTNSGLLGNPRRSVLKSSAKNYKPDILPRRESRWQTESSTTANSSWRSARKTNCDTLPVILARYHQQQS